MKFLFICQVMNLHWEQEINKAPPYYAELSMKEVEAQERFESTDSIAPPLTLD